MSKIIEGLYYTEDHEWIQIDGDTATIGITDFAQSSLGDIVFVELPEEGETLEASNSFGVVESIKSVSDLYTPLTGEVVEKNNTIEDSPESLNEDAYASWLVKIKLSNKDEIKSLMDSKAYQNYCEANS
ncbi:MAG: glycine cleavage system protein GcvH [Bacteriovoracaceae bacterium]|jgi:glycine cleavage system H protein|nr:glycine cleavage system protein H [Halobacteriovoraceae bacterium]MDP7321789.1 glycine cleavage system protein GcvH [Bacteriovoracaceae bacterium]|tara:strand:+ start:285 stop:671 length:387 start_codon:yes stop_codon:yes gene_type:complete